jgi:hypothetical protein
MAQRTGRIGSASPNSRVFRCVPRFTSSPSRCTSTASPFSGTSFSPAIPKGEFAKGKWQGAGTEVPGKDVLLEMFKAQPTALLLDEFQTWFDGL